jgi:hypothetical protein
MKFIVGVPYPATYPPTNVLGVPKILAGDNNHIMSHHIKCLGIMGLIEYNSLVMYDE